MYNNIYLQIMFHKSAKTFTIFIFYTFNRYVLKNYYLYKSKKLVVKMQKKQYLLILSLSLFTTIMAQEYRWSVELDYFFDNTEYKKSSFLDSETMNGVWLNPAGGIVWNNNHSVNAGVNLLKIPGTDKIADNLKATLYYQYKTANILFRAGSFPKKELFNNYNNFFFKDSVNNFIPLMEGVFIQFGKGGNFINGWFDRTGYATANSREHFFVGLSGKASKGLFYVDFQSYMYHLSNTKPASPDGGVSENLQLQATLGIDYNDVEKFAGLVAAGTLMGYERDRRFEDKLYKPVGFVARADAELWGIGTKNLFYIGDRRMRLAETFGGDLYWGTQFLQSKSYIKNEWYIRLIESESVKVKLNCNIHFSEGNALMQQLLTVSASIDNLNFKKNKKITYPWKGFLNN